MSSEMPMSPHEASLKRLITEGIITDEEAARLCSEAESQNCRPLDLLEERGIISPQTRADFEESNLDPETINPYTEAVGEDEETVNPLPIIDERTINPDAGQKIVWAKPQRFLRTRPRALRSLGKTIPMHQ